MLKTLTATVLSLALFRLHSAPAFYDTYAAWGDTSGSRHGHLYLYTGSALSTDYFLYATGTPGTTINGLVQSQSGLGPFVPAIEYPNAGGAVGFGASYYKLSATQPMTWEVDETTECHCGDTHGFVAAADNNNKHRGSVFMTYMRQDTDTDSSGTQQGMNEFGDDAAVINADSVTLTATVSRWSGSAWGAPLLSSPPIPPGGVWMWSPDEDLNQNSGGTLASSEGHYRVDVSGGYGMLYKGNFYTPFVKPDWNRDNVWLVAPDLLTGKKIGTDLVGAIDKLGRPPQIIVTNMGTAPADFEILTFTARTPGTHWPVNGGDATGVWTTAFSLTGLAPGASFDYDNTLPGRQAVTYARVHSTNGQLLEASMGTGLTASRFEGGDYFYGKDTLQSIGKLFSWGGFLNNTVTWMGPLEVHVVAPSAGSTVTLNVTGSVTGAYPAQVQSTTGPDTGLIFNVSSTTDQSVQFSLSADQYVYAWAMSNSGSPSEPVYSARFGETFFSNPPTPQNLISAFKSVNTGMAALGDTITYTLGAKNIGTTDMLTAWVWDTLPAGLSLVSAVPPPSVSNPPLYGWDLSPLGALRSASITLTARIDTASPGEIKHNQALAAAFSSPDSLSPDAPVSITFAATPTMTFTPVPTPTPVPPPLTLHLYPNSPNPFGSGGTFIAYFLSVDADCELRIFDVAGETVRDLEPFHGKRGDNEAFWDGLNQQGKAVASGSYIYRLTAKSPRGESAVDFRKCASIR